MVREELIDFTELSFLAQRIFIVIERELFRRQTKEAHITKEQIAWLATMSVPNVKIGLRELKNTGYIVSKNKNSSTIKVGEEYEYRER